MSTNQPTKHTLSPQTIITYDKGTTTLHTTTENLNAVQGAGEMS